MSANNSNTYGVAQGDVTAYDIGPEPAVLNPDRMPAPSATTLGGVQSFAATPHEWINQISTAGVPSASQPTYSDIAGPLVYTPKAIANAASPYSVLAADMFLAVSAGVSTPTVIDLPAATGSGRVLIVKKVDANAQNVAVTPHGTDDIDGANSAFNISTQYTAYSFIDYAAGQWGIMATYP
jgi:hypothetical protein